MCIAKKHLQYGEMWVALLGLVLLFVVVVKLLVPLVVRQLLRRAARRVGNMVVTNAAERMRRVTVVPG